MHGKATWLALCLCAGCAMPSHQASAMGGKVVGGVSLRAANVPAALTEGGRLRIDVVFTNHSGAPVYLAANTMVGSPSFRLEKLGADGRPVGEALEHRGWCQGILMGDEAVEILPGGSHTEMLWQDNELPQAVTASNRYRVTVSLRYHIHAPTVVGAYGDPNARPLPDEAVWRGDIDSNQFVVMVKALDVNVSNAGSGSRPAGRSPLDKTVSFAFKETPVADALKRLSELSGARIAWDRDVPEKPITLTMNNTSLRVALSWIGMMASPDSELETTDDGEVRVTRHPRLTAKIYDVRDIEYQEWALAQVIKTRLAPETWTRSGREMTAPRNGLLLVTQSGEVHEAIARLLAQWREDSAAEAARRAARKGSGKQ